MKITIRYSILAMLLLTALGVRAQRFTGTDNATTATLSDPVINNVFLTPVQAQRHTAVKYAAGQSDTGLSTGMQGSVFGSDLFGSRRRSLSGRTLAQGGSGTSGSGYEGVAAISAYSQLTVDNIVAGSTRRGVIPPPPPTPDPDDPEKLPVGDALWLLLLLAAGYGALAGHRYIKKRS